MSKVYNFNEYDKHMCLKLSVEVWLVILYLLRPLLVLVASLRTKQSTGTRELIYADDFSFTLGILATIPVIILLIGWAKRKPDAGRFVRAIWRNGVRLLSTAAVLNIIIVIVPVVMGTISRPHMSGWIQIALSILILVYLYTSQRVKDTFADFPVESSE